MASTAATTSISTDEPEPPPLLHADEIVGRIARVARTLSTEDASASLGKAVERARVHVELARTTTERGRAEHRAQGAPQLVRPTPREAELAALTAPKPLPPQRSRVSAEHTKHLRALDTSIAAVRDHLLKNPLWIAATHLERVHPAAKAEDLLSKDPDLTRARSELARAEAAMTRANRALEAWNTKPSWLRGLQNFVLGSGDKVHTDFNKAAEQLIAQNRATQSVETEARFRYEDQAADLNASAREKQEEARRVREALEAPLRAVLLERAIAQDIVAQGVEIRPLREAPAQERLEFAGIRAERGVSYHEFRSPNALYRADSIDLAASTHVAALTPGDKFAYSVTPEGARALALVERGPHIGLDQPHVEGVVGATHRDGEKLLKFEITDERGASHWVVPTRGDDIYKELSGDLATAISAGNHLVIQNREATVVERDRERERSVDIDI